MENYIVKEGKKHVLIQDNNGLESEENVCFKCSLNNECDKMDNKTLCEDIMGVPLSHFELEELEFNKK